MPAMAPNPELSITTQTTDRPPCIAVATTDMLLLNAPSDDGFSEAVSLWPVLARTSQSRATRRIQLLFRWEPVEGPVDLLAE
jgi:hypothetical protein